MKGFIGGMVVGAALVYAFLVYPDQSKKVVSQGVDTASSAVVQGASAAQRAADEHLKQGK
jgi:hypothetical protein